MSTAIGRPARLILGLGLLWSAGSSPAPLEHKPTLRQQLLAALGAARVTHGMLVGEGKAPGSGERVSRESLLAIQRALERSRSPRDHATSALVFLSDRRNLDRALSRLEQARAEVPGDAEIATDLSAVYLEKGIEQAEPQAFLLALCHAHAAVRLDRRLPEARFNLGVVLHQLGLVEAARRAFTAYLGLDTSARGSAEAQAHLVSLAAPTPAEVWEARRPEVEAAAGHGDAARLRWLLDGLQQRGRSYVELDILDRWSDYRAHGDIRRAAAELTKARALAAEISAATGDPMLEDAVAAIDRAGADPAATAALADGHRAFARAMRLMSAYRTSEAAEGFRSADKALRRGRSPFHLWALIKLSGCNYQVGQYRDALRHLAAVRRESAVARYPVLAGNVEWLRGLIALIGDRLRAAQASYSAALASFARAGDSGDQAVVECLLFEIFDLLNEDREAWRHAYSGLRDAPFVEEPRRRQLIARSAAAAALKSIDPQVALYFESESVKWAMVAGNPVQIATALRDRANLYQRTGQAKLGAGDIERALAFARHAKDEALVADVLVTKAAIVGGWDPAAALACLSAALPVLVQTDHQEGLAALYLLRGRLHLLSGRRDLAAADFSVGVSRLERTLGGMDDAARLRYVDRSTELFDGMIALAAAEEGGDRALAFSYVERSRARALAELLGQQRLASAGAAGAAGIHALASRLRPGTVLIEYSVLPDRLVAWAVTRAGAYSTSVPIGAAEVEQGVIRLRSALGAHRGFTAASGSLFQFLVAPLQIPNGAELVIVPDKSLYHVPFAALRDPATGHFLIEDHVLVLAPSASIYALCAARGQLAGGSSLSVLLVTDPAFDRALAPSLPRLPGAGEEAAAIGRLYHRIDQVAGAAATRARVLRELGRHQIVHFAGHVAADGSSAFSSHLLLAPDGQDSGILSARDLYGRRFAATRLVVLAGCNTAADQVSGSEGVSSLARPFLAAGVPSVVGSLWAVEDRSAARFSIELHQRLAAGDPAAAALRGAELALLHSGSPELADPRTWAAFELFGASAPLPRRAAT